MPEFPKPFRKGKFTVTVYGPSPSDSRFRVIWRHSRTRNEKKFRQYKDAERFAKSVLEHLERGDLPSRSLSHTELAEHEKATELAEQEGYGLLAAIREWKDTRDQLPEGYNLQDAVRALKGKCSLRSTTIAELVDAYADEQKRRLKKGGYLRQTLAVLRKMRSAFNFDLTDLSNQHLIALIEEGNVSEKTRQNYSGVVSGLLTWAIKHEYLPADTPLTYAIRGRKTKRETNVSFYRPKDFQLMLDNASAPIKVRILLSGLCGVRTEEALRVTTEDIVNHHLQVNAQKAKTSARRLVQLTGELESFLLGEPTFRTTYPEDRYYKETRNLRNRLGIQTHQNGLRHSYISYRLSIIKNAAQVAEESGTSIEKVNSNYRELVIPEEAALWFSVKY